MLNPEQLRIVERLHKALTLHHHPRTGREESRAAGLRAQTMGERATDCGIPGALLVAVGAAAREQLPLQAALDACEDATARPRRAGPAKAEPRPEPRPDGHPRRPDSARRAQKRPAEGTEGRTGTKRAAEAEAQGEAQAGAKTTHRTRAANEPPPPGERRTRRSTRVDRRRAWESVIELRANIDLALATSIAARVGVTLWQDSRTGASMVGGTAAQVAEFARVYQAAVDRAAAGS